jgi:hypothetical protein
MLDDRAVRQQLAEALADEQGERFFQARLRTMVSKGEDPGAMAAMVKLAFAARYQKTSGLGMELRGLDGIAPDPDDRATPELQYDYLFNRHAHRGRCRRGAQKPDFRTRAGHAGRSPDGQECAV